jgi:hypothetical protein
LRGRNNRNRIEQSTDAKMSLRRFQQATDGVIENEEASSKLVTIDPCVQMGVNGMTTLDHF